MYTTNTNITIIYYIFHFSFQRKKYKEAYFHSDKKKIYSIYNNLRLNYCFCVHAFNYFIQNARNMILRHLKKTRQLQLQLT
jgi:hypothetical protein